MPVIDYQRRLAADRVRSQQVTRAGQDISCKLTPANKRRRNRACKKFRYFCEQYFPETFTLKFSKDHLRAIETMETSVRDGGLYAFAMPRGSGKTTLCERATIWAILSGYHAFVALIGADLGKSQQALQSIKIELETNPLLFEDFPLELVPFLKLDGEARRAIGQRWGEDRTYVGWKADEIVFGRVPGSKASGAVIRVAGLTASIRGMKHTLPGGESVRPSLVVLDDPQTRESAASPSQCATREQIVAGDVLGMAGPGAKISALMPCTVIHEHDLADNMLNREKHPDWQGQRTKMVYSFPSNHKMWEQYEEIRADSLRAGRGIKDATAFYRKNRKEMDAGAVVAWKQRHNKDEVSAVQHAMNLMIRDRGAFYAEYQNEPLPREDLSQVVVTADEIMVKDSGLPFRTAPVGSTKVTAFIDVQQDAVFYAVCAWEEGFTGVVIDYGSFPEQGASYWTLKDIRRSLSDEFPRAGFEGTIYSGLEACCARILGDVVREDQAKVPVDLCVLDANWGKSTEVVRRFSRRSDYSNQLMPGHGRYVGASTEPLGERRMSKSRKRGERYGHNWQTSIIEGTRHLIYDTNFWKSFIHSRFACTLGDKGSLSLFKDKPTRHRMFADHITAEYSVRTEARGRTVDEWKQRPDKPDNHWLDCVVGCAAAASYLGISLEGQPKTRPAQVVPQTRVRTRMNMAGRDGGSFFITAR